MLNKHCDNVFFIVKILYFVSYLISNKILSCLYIQVLFHIISNHFLLEHISMKLSIFLMNFIQERERMIEIIIHNAHVLILLLPWNDILCLNLKKQRKQINLNKSISLPLYVLSVFSVQKKKRREKINISNVQIFNWRSLLRENYLLTFKSYLSLWFQ